MQQNSMQLILAALLVALAGASMLRKTNEVPKKGTKIKDPLKESIGDVLPNQPAPPPDPQEYDHMYVPHSPGNQPDYSPTDPIERSYGWEGAVANMMDDMTSDEGMRFEGSTCQSVCAACTIYAAQLESAQCFCYATCKLGECGNGAAIHHGWSNNVVSTPRTLWRASCNVGEKNCESQCMKDELKKKVKECEEDTKNPAACFRRLSSLNQPVHLDARKDVVYCTRKGLSTCDKFVAAPQDPEWLCYDEFEPCRKRLINGWRIPMQSVEAPAVWTQPRL